MTPSQSRQTARQSLPDSLRNCLSLDIEVSRQSGEIVAAAACNPQTGRTWRRAAGSISTEEGSHRDQRGTDLGHGRPERVPAHGLAQIVTLRKWLPQMICYRKFGPQQRAVRHSAQQTMESDAASAAEGGAANESQAVKGSNTPINNWEWLLASDFWPSIRTLCRHYRQIENGCQHMLR